MRNDVLEHKVRSRGADTWRDENVSILIKHEAYLTAEAPLRRRSWSNRYPQVSRARVHHRVYPRVAVYNPERWGIDGLMLYNDRNTISINHGSSLILAARGGPASPMAGR